MIDFVNKRFLYFTFSLLVMVPGIISMLLPGGLKAGIEFSSGSTFSVQFQQPVSADDLRVALAELGHADPRIQRTTEGTFLVRTDLIEGAAQSPPFGPAPPSEREEIETALESRFGPLVDTDGNVTNRFNEFSSVSASVSSDITRNAAFAVVASSIAILIFITFSFWSMPSPVRYGTATVVALAHDVVMTMGIASIIGRVSDFEIDSLFITAMLTIIGFSVHDTIVVFDRIRENVSRAEQSGYRPTLAQAVNASLNQTLGRSLNTSITLFLSILTLILLGGDTIQDFLLTMMVGLISGTYSSIFIASQLLVAWDEGDLPGFRPHAHEEAEVRAQPQEA
jgi:preprotein translocase subunit SecF